MKYRVSFLFLLSLVFFACNTDNDELGVSLRPNGDDIILGVDSFDVTTKNFVVDSIYSRPDSMLFGKFVNDEYGTVCADILAQLMPPINAQFPDGAKGDSAKLIIGYTTFFGDGYSPFNINVYQMDKNNIFDDNGAYLSSIKPDDYCTKNILLGSKVATATDYGASRTDTTSIFVKLNDSFVKSFESELTSTYPKPTDVINFHKKFNGVYVTTDFGTATMLNVSAIVLRYYYSYTYKLKSITGADSTTVTVNTYHDYPASSEVRVVNRIVQKNQKSVLDAFNAKANVNLVASPANIYTQVTFPYSLMRSSMLAKVNNKKLLLNRAMFRVYVDEYSTEDLAVPLVSTMLMLNEDSVSNYFKSRKVPSAYGAVVGTLAYEYDSNDSIRYYYDFNMATLLSNVLQTNKYIVGGVTNDIKFRLVPVSVTYNGSGSVIEYKELQLLRASKLCSPTHSTYPMKLQMVFSGF